MAGGARVSAVTRGSLAVARYRFRSNLRRRRAEHIGLVLLIGVVGGVSIGAIAGARRTATSFPTYLASTNPSTFGVFTALDNPAFGLTTGYNPQALRKIRALPLVARAVSDVIFDGNIDLTSVKGIRNRPRAAQSPPTIEGSADGYYSSVDRVTLIAGRLTSPTSLDEAVVSPETEIEWGIHVGSVIKLPFYSDAQVQSSTPSGPPHIVTLKIVGVVIESQQVVQSDSQMLGSNSLVMSAGLTRQLEDRFAYATGTFIQVKGGDRNAARVIAQIARIVPFSAHQGTYNTSSIVPVAQQVITPVAVALAVFGVLAGLATLLIAGLVIGRVVRVEVEESSTLRALGTRPLSRVIDVLSAPALSVGAGVLVSIAVAVALSPLTPIGPARPVFPGRGLAFDPLVLCAGALFVIAVLGAVATVIAVREVRHTGSRRSRGVGAARWYRSAFVSALPLSTATGLRFALEPGGGRRSSAVRSVLIGAVLAVTVVATTVTFASSLDGLVSHPALYGWNWDDVLLSSFAGAEDLPGPQVTRFLNADQDIAAWSGINFVRAKVDGHPVGLLAEAPGSSVGPPIVSGHGLLAADQIVLGPRTLAQIHARVGDTITLDNGVTPPVRLTVVGTAAMPTLTNGSDMGRGGVVATSLFPAKLLNIQGAQIVGPNAVLVRGRPGVSAGALYRSLEVVNHQVNAFRPSSGLGGGVVSLLRPAEIVNFRTMGTTPTLLAVSLAGGAIAALGLTLAASVRRRRRDLAVLKALGFTGRQLSGAVIWQAVFDATIGVVVGLPLGIWLGRALWSRFARTMSAVPDPTVPVLAMAAIGVGAVLFAVAVSVLPGRRAASTPVAIVLRAE